MRAAACRNNSRSSLINTAPLATLGQRKGRQATPRDAKRQMSSHRVPSLADHWPRTATANGGRLARVRHPNCIPSGALGHHPLGGSWAQPIFSCKAPYPQLQSVLSPCPWNLKT